ncbi:bifunctional PIG-L family deacetylase/class I SAM-dependent methyltransferase [Microbacterium sp. SLBN-146]|uniref:bifunctional PIG-L family deacetylase/class I SAM-dependent methyltransferase n=1 Tax=Microbacterium sp. SLBN-146 TaxID=2768457 RepID=UPI0011680F8F|nr:bifunctional PIG-L family deacetylase/class I SAM-dependent methyltransferase [Microbacterium sp. SLBN-146]TQJ31150.1 LmbE family N-acetylglucosaminyl deacetylase [Microbacterium sp. SLBN-146]
MSFSHLDEGTPEAVWAEAFADVELPPLEIDHDELVIVAAHPDDESLGAGGLAHDAARRGIRVRVVVVTDGENSHPASRTIAPVDLAAVRRREVSAAVRELSPHATVEFLGIPDGGIEGESMRVAAYVRRIVADAAAAAPRVLVVAPWEGDGHRDHRLVGRVAREVAEELGADYRGYPIWLWHWGTAADAPWASMERVRLDDAACAAKRAALARHESQNAPLSREPGDEAILHDGMRAHFARPFEILVRPDARPASREHFDAVFRQSDDPWGFESRWYEERKRSLLLAALPHERYGAVLELGCATGVLTERLAERCDSVVAIDFSSTALAHARARLSDRRHVDLRVAELPREWPDGRFDLIVFSEIGYYWDAAALDEGIVRMAASLTPGGHLVACHWRHPIPEGPYTGDTVHAALRASNLDRVVRHDEPDFLLDVFSRRSTDADATPPGTLP